MKKNDKMKKTSKFWKYLTFFKISQKKNRKSMCKLGINVKNVHELKK